MSAIFLVNDRLTYGRRKVHAIPELTIIHNQMTIELTAEVIIDFQTYD